MSSSPINIPIRVDGSPSFKVNPEVSFNTRRNPQIRALLASDDLTRLTKLIHAAYASHAAQGLRFWATHQSIEDTAKRFSCGHGLVAELQGEYVGTITVRPPQPESPVPLYREPHTWSFLQFAVEPAFKGRGFGKMLHEAAVALAQRNGAQVMVIDTAAPATSLIAMYLAWGYTIVGEHDWRPHTNYPSVLMQRSCTHPLR